MTTTTHAEVARLYQQGLDEYAIAAQLRLPTDTVMRILDGIERVDARRQLAGLPGVLGDRAAALLSGEQPAEVHPTAPGTTSQPRTYNPTTPTPEPAPAVEPACGDKPGTHTGIARHKRAGEQLCPDCLEARRSYQRQYQRQHYDAEKRRAQHQAAKPDAQQLVTPAEVKPRVRIQWLLPPTSPAHVEYAADLGNDRLEPINPATAAQLAADGVTIWARTTTDWQPVNPPQAHTA